MLELKRRPPITCDIFFNATKIPSNILDKVLSEKEKYYYTYEIPKKKGGTRPITPSVRQLKTIQKHTKKFIESCIKWPFYLHGGIGGRSVLTNAKHHVGKYMVTNIDIEKCFPNTSCEIVETALLNMGFEKRLAGLLSDICTYNNCLPQGAPTSTCMSNIALGMIDCEFFKFCRKNRFKYSRFVDDITISGYVDLRPYKNTFIKFIESLGYAISTYCPMPRSKAQVVTGLTVNDKVRPTSLFIKELKSDIKSRWSGNDNLELVANEYGLTISELKKNIWGRINFLKSMDRKSGQAIRGLMTRVVWPSDELEKN